MDVTKLKAFDRADADDHGNREREGLARPVLKTFYDHTQEINDIDFHPTQPILISCSKDKTVKFYDFKSNVKRAFKYIQDTHNIRSVALHPSGDYLLVGTDHPAVRLYDVNNFQAYTSRRVTDHHQDSVHMVRYSLEGNVWASCSKDGSIKLWDGISNSLISTIPKAHAGSAVDSVQFSASQRYLLSCGKDECIRLWELTTSRLLLKISVGSQSHSSSSGRHRTVATFNYNEDFIVGCDEAGMAGVVWDARTGDQVQRLGGHTNVVRYVAASPTENCLISCSNDSRARFWRTDNMMT
eukprot:TRINITY_DN8526_c0_g1_i3.p1 TRINITY_DN8526_c0_g1~~TRINITY_DN8526_c0_g1_i3.p1  ORF type:complete len:336 (+),score=60.68 TRINITY_DN8526_c0_g1_i3:118-1008(+)